MRSTPLTGPVHGSMPCFPFQRIRFVLHLNRCLLSDKAVEYSLDHFPEPSSPLHPLRQFQYRRDGQSQTKHDNPIHQGQVERAKGIMQERHVNDQEQQDDFPQYCDIEPFVGKWPDSTELRSERKLYALKNWISTRETKVIVMASSSAAPRIQRPAKHSQINQGRPKPANDHQDDDRAGENPGF